MSRPIAEAPIIPPQTGSGFVPETIIIEANRTISELNNPGLNTDAHEWETPLSEVLEIKRGDEIRVSNVFLNQIGADSSVITFNDASTDLQNNKTRIVYSFYGCDDGTNNKRKVIDMLGKAAANVGFTKEFNTYNDIPLYRFQNNGLELSYSDLTDATKGQFFGSGAVSKGLINYLDFWNDEVTFTNRIIAPYEDRYLPGVFYNNIFLRTPNATSQLTNYFKVKMDLNQGQLIFSNGTAGAPTNDNLTSYIQPGMIVCLQTDSTALGSTSNQYWDNYYFVKATNPSATHEDCSISLDFNNQNVRQSSNFFNVIPTEPGTTTAPNTPQTIKFDSNQVFGKQVKVGTYLTDVSLGVSTIFAADSKITNISTATPSPHNFTSITGFGESGQAKWRVSDITSGGAITSPLEFFANSVTYFGSTNSRVISVVADATPNFTRLTPLATASIGDLSADFVYHNEEYLFYTASDNTPDTHLRARADFGLGDSNYLLGTDTIEQAINVRLSYAYNRPDYLYVEDKSNLDPIGTHKYLITNQTPNDDAIYNNLPFITSIVDRPTDVIQVSPNRFTTGIQVHITDVNGSSGIKEIFKDSAGFPVYNIEHMTITIHSGAGFIQPDTQVYSCREQTDPSGNTEFILQVNKSINGATPSTIFNFQNDYGVNSGYLIFNRDLNNSGSLDVLSFTTEDGQFDAGYESVGMTIHNNTKTLFATISAITWNKQQRYYEITTSTPLGSAGTSAGQTQIILQSNIFGTRVNGTPFDTSIGSQVINGQTSTISFGTTLKQNIPLPNTKLTINVAKPFTNSGTLTMSENLVGTIPTSTLITLNEIETLITINNQLLTPLPPNTDIFFTPVPSGSNTPVSLGYHIKILPQGYNFTNVNAGFYSQYGYTDEVRPKKGDRFSQYAYNRLNDTSTLTTNIKKINTTSDKNVVASIQLEDPITSLSATGGYTENSLVLVGVNKLLNFTNNGDGTASITIKMNDVANFNQPGTTGIMSEANPSTNTIFNMQRGVGIKLSLINDTSKVEYLRIPNGVNDTGWTNATATYSNVNELTITLVQRRFFEPGLNNTGQYNPIGAIDWSSLSTANPSNVKIELLDLTHSYSEWNGKTNSSVNTIPLIGNPFTTNNNYAYGQSFIMIKDNIDEIDFINPVKNQDRLLYTAVSSFSPLDVLGFGQANYFYTGGTNRGLTTNYFQGTSPRDKGDFVLHREFLDIDLTSAGTNLSPSDIANIITEQTHSLRKAKINVSVDSMLNGFDFPNSEGFGLPTNRFFIPIVSNPYQELGSTNSANTPIDGITFTGSPSSIDGCFRFHNFYFNYNLVDPLIVPDGGQPGFNYPAGSVPANSHINNTMLPIYPRTTEGYAITNNCFVQGTQSLKTYPITLIGDTLKYAVSFAQYCGTNNATMGFSSNFNRLALSFLHQPYISASIDKGDKIVGGVQAIRYFYPYKTRQFDKTKPIGKPYWDRFGGVNIECYAGNFIESGGTYFNSIDNITSSENYTTTDINKLNPIGRRFWNKLGFSDKQITENLGHTFSESDTSGYIVLKGTTGQLVDSATGYTSELPTATSFQSQFEYPGLAAPSGTPTLPANGGADWVSQTSVGGLSGLANTNTQTQGGSSGTSTYVAGAITSAHTGYNAPATSGEPLIFDGTNFTGNQDNLKFAKTDGTQPQNSDPIDSTGNSLIGAFGFTIAAESDILKADNLPIKTINSYYLLFCKELGGSNNFYTTSNRGNINPEAMAIISSLNTQSDFYFSYQSPISFFAKNDIRLSRITTRVLNADLSVPTTLGKNSSVIYQIIRFNPKPPLIEPTLSQRQEAYFQTMDELEKQQAANIKASQSNISQIIDAITEAALVPSDDQSELISSIIERAQNMGILNVSPQERKRILENDPEANDLLTEIEELQTARQGVFTGALAQVQDAVGLPGDEPQQQQGGVIIEPEPMDDTLNNQIIQEAFDKRLRERSQFRAGVENVRERIERLGEVAENPIIQEYATRRGLEQRITLGGTRRGVGKEEDIRRRRIQFRVDPSERRPEDIELRVDTEGNINRARKRASARIRAVRNQPPTDVPLSEQTQRIREEQQRYEQEQRQEQRRIEGQSGKPAEGEDPAFTFGEMSEALQEAAPRED